MQFPLDLRFKLLAIASQIYVRDAQGGLVCYVKQKAFKLKEAVTVFADEGQTQPLYRIAADRMLDISAQYHVEDMQGRQLGVVKRRGLRSIWRTQYEVSRDGALLFTIQEENPWVKVVDGFFEQIPVLGMLSGYVFHPAYLLIQGNGTTAMRVSKQPALLEGRYRVDALGALTDEDARLAVLSLLMMLLLERSRG
jgi:hypothetical protein